MNKNSLKINSVSYVFIIASILLCIGFTPSIAQNQDPVFVLEQMDKELIIGQRARENWGHFWSGPAVTGINLGYLAERGYPKLVPGSGEGLSGDDLINLVDLMGSEEYMNTNQNTGTTDPELLWGLAKYISEKYPDTFEITVYENEFRAEYRNVVGKNLPEELFGVPINVFTNPNFNVYEKELRNGEMIWLGLPQANTNLNHFLAGRSFDTRENLSGNYPVDFGEPREQPFDPGKGQIIQTVMTKDGALEYEEEMKPADIMIALSPLKEEAKDGMGDGLTCQVDCTTETEKVCVESETSDSTCAEWTCRGVLYQCGSSPHGTQCCDGSWQCESYTQGETTCVEYGEREITKCKVTVNNAGKQSVNPHTDEVSVKYEGTGCDFSGKSKKLWWQTMEPGESNNASIEFTPPTYCSVSAAVCEIDVFDALEETSNE